MDISKYDATIIEDKWYNYWLKNDYFESTPNNRKPYTIVIPPPNVTGVLHMGHVLNNTIQDVLIRRARLKNLNACWVPGIDHASIATEAKVVAKLKSEGVEKSQLSREDFIKHAWDWTHKHGGIILEQLKKLGCSCDWKRTKFTMDNDMSESVIEAFITLFNKGLIYRGYRMVNYDPKAKTTLSDEEVIHVEQQGLLYYIVYDLEHSKEKITIATTRPETIFGDAAICINPNDSRYTHFIGKKAIVPICNRLIPIIADDYIDTEFGTGCLKVTPAHDQNDKVIGEKHHLEFIDIFDDKACLNTYGLHYEGRDRFDVRKAISKELQEKGLLVKVENHTHKVGTSERTGSIIEPKMSVQWFLKMDELSKPALKTVLDKEIRLFPKNIINTYKNWMENIRDWNISRQLWWGHQIPAYFYNDTDFVIAKNPEEALKLAQKKSDNYKLTNDDLTQDSDVLDTWFSSWLWPISVFDGIRNPDNKEINYYYPTNDLITAPEILFFWVARMIVSGYEFRNEKPFNNVYFTGIVRDKKRRKMSKSLGNSPNPLDLIAQYGADGVRVGMLLCAPAGNDLIFDEDLCKQGSSFSNKIWNAFRLIKSWEIHKEKVQPQATALGLLWFENRLQEVLKDIESHYNNYRISEALIVTYKLFWDDFCSWLLEIIKPPYGESIDRKTYDSTITLFESLLKILHPFVPFISEHIWQEIAPRSPKEALIISQWPKQKQFDTTLLDQFNFSKSIITNVRVIRSQKIIFKNSIELFYINNEKIEDKFRTIVIKLCNLSCVEQVEEYKKINNMSFRVKSNEYFVPVNQSDSKKEFEKLKEELQYAESFLKSVQSKLSNKRFISNAPSKIVEIERQKETDTIAKINAIKNSLEAI